MGSGAVRPSRRAVGSREVVAVLYHDPVYWDMRYEDNCAAFEWYCGWFQLGSAITPLVTERSVVLYVGCGTSVMGYALSKFVARVVNIDKCRRVAAAMARACSTKNNTYLARDCRETGFDDEEFDLVFEKAMVDGMLTSAEMGGGLVDGLVREVARTLVPGGCFVSVSRAGEERRWLFERTSLLRWERAEAVPNVISPGRPYFVHVLRKRDGVSVRPSARLVGRLPQGSGGTDPDGAPGRIHHTRRMRDD